MKKILLSLILAFTLNTNQLGAMDPLPQNLGELNGSLSVLKLKLNSLSGKLKTLQKQLSEQAQPVGAQIPTGIGMPSFAVTAPAKEVKEKATLMSNSREPAKASAATYSVNLMWVNRDLNGEQRYICPAKDEETLKKNFLNHIFDWANVSQGGVVNLWFDSAMIPAEAIKNTQVLIEDYAHVNQSAAPIVLRDVRSIPKVTEHLEVFGVKVPVYFRVDLLRAIIAVHMLTNGETACFVYGDLDMEPLSQEQLFDSETQQNLKKYGIVVAACNIKEGFENGFVMISNDNANLLEALKWAVIELNIRRAYNALQGQFFPGDTNSLFRKNAGPMENLQQAVYESYPAMFKYFYSLEGYGKFRVYSGDGKDGWKTYRDYDKDKDGLYPFGLKHVMTKNKFIRFVPNSDQPSYRVQTSVEKHLKMPTKTVVLPSTIIGSYKDPLFEPTSPNYTPHSSKDPTSLTDLSTW